MRSGWKSSKLDAAKFLLRVIAPMAVGKKILSELKFMNI
jgi:hypothetical protein